MFEQRRRVGAHLGRLLQAARQPVGEGRAPPRRVGERGRRRRRDLEERAHHGAHVVVRRRHLGELDRGDAERPHVGRVAVAGVRRDDLGREPVRRADDRHPPRHRRRELRRDAEVAELERAVGREEEVGRLDVAVQQPPRVEVAERLERRAARGADLHLAERRAAVPHHVEQRAAFAQLGHDPQAAAVPQRRAPRQHVRRRAALQQLQLLPRLRRRRRRRVRRAARVHRHHLDRDEIAVVAIVAP